MGKSKGNIVDIYDKETQEQIANELEAYLSMINLVILENRTEKEIDEHCQRRGDTVYDGPTRPVGSAVRYAPSCYPTPEAPPHRVAAH